MYSCGCGSLHEVKQDVIATDSQRDILGLSILNLPECRFQLEQFGVICSEPWV